MNQIKELKMKIRKPQFWDYKKPSFIAYFLLPLSATWALKECSGSPLKTKYFSIPSSWHNCEATFVFTDKVLVEFN